MLNWLELVLQSSQMTIEAHEVVQLRVERMLKGGSNAALEAQRMVSEKSLVIGEAWFSAASAMSKNADAAAVASAFLLPYRRRVRANRRRLSK